MSPADTKINNSTENEILQRKERTCITKILNTKHKIFSILSFTVCNSMSIPGYRNYSNNWRFKNTVSPKIQSANNWNIIFRGKIQCFFSFLWSCLGMFFCSICRYLSFFVVFVVVSKDFLQTKGFLTIRQYWKTPFKEPSPNNQSTKKNVKEKSNPPII